ncbi:MAG TPA: hypothetical protein VK002_06100 [Rubricoccaceae bacterium]|jgi:hypothetical protein|nr:hypothetical protein [Rubricoccaceae bacterium]
MRTRYALVALALALTGCDSEDNPPPYMLELDRLRAATDAFQDFNAAAPAGYAAEVINPATGDSYFPMMGVHYLNPNLLDDHFDVEHPEILIYLPHDDGHMELVAVEYATPIADLDAPPPAPAGFTGTADAWSINEDFSLWTLHAWVWMDNPSGVFAPHNPDVP